MIDIFYYNTRCLGACEPIASMRGHVPNRDDEIILGSPDGGSGRLTWIVYRVRRYHWFDLVEGAFREAANVYITPYGEHE